jgi:hypothetical protein
MEELYSETDARDMETYFSAYIGKELFYESDKVATLKYLRLSRASAILVLNNLRQGYAMGLVFSNGRILSPAEFCSLNHMPLIASAHPSATFLRVTS